MTEEHTDETAEALTAFVERIERLSEEKDAISNDIKDVYAELKGRGFEPKVVKKIVADRKLDREERKELQAIYEVYEAALGM